MYQEKFFIRRLSKPLLNFLKKTNISAEELTLFRLFFGIFAVLMILFGSFTQAFIIVFLYQFVIFLDYVDGSIARYRGNFKLSWVYVDLMGHITLSFLFLLAVTISYYLKTESILLLSLGLLASFLFLFNNVLNKRSSFDQWKEVHKNIKNNKPRKFTFFIVFLRIDRPFGLFFVLFLFNLSFVLIPLYATIYTLTVIHKFYSELKSIENEK
jgi:phosphatidylglycerophosphate synthase